MVAELLLHPDKYPDKLAATRKVCKLLASELGMTRADLRPALQAKLDEFQNGPGGEKDEATTRFFVGS